MTIEIPLTQGQMALIDDEDFELVNQHNWHAAWNEHGKTFYAMTNTVRRDGTITTEYMHRLILGAKRGQHVDHIHHLTLDNRRSEIRLCNNAQNAHNSGPKFNNTSGYKGVCWHKHTKKWRARIRVSGKRIFLGYYLTPEAAHSAYCEAAHRLHGEFARTT